MANTAPKTWADKFFWKDVQQAGVLLPSQPVINFVGNVSIADNPTNGSTDVTVGTGGGQYTTALANGLNSNVPTSGLTALRIGGPTGAFSVGGFALPGGAAPGAGTTLVVVNTTSSPMTIVNADASSTAQYRISTPTGQNVLLPPRSSAATFVYDGTTSHWVLKDTGLISRWKANVLDFGAVGDGSTDDSGAIALGLAFVALLGGTLLFPSPPVAYTSSTVQNVAANTSLEGDNRLTSIVKFTGATNGFVWSNASEYGEGGKVVELTITSSNAGSGDGLQCTNLSLAKVERCVFTGWGNGRATYFHNCVVSAFDQCLVQGCGSSTLAQVEVDGLSVGGGTTFRWDQSYISGGNAGNTTVAGLRIDRTANLHIFGGAIESTGTPIQIASKSEGTQTLVGGIILGIDLENPNNGAVSYLDVGAGWTGGAGGATTNLRVLGVTTSASGSKTAYKGFRFYNTDRTYVDGCNVVLSPGVGIPTWAATTVYAPNALIQPETADVTGYYYQNLGSSGTSGSNAAIFAGVTTIGATVVDGAVTWTCVGQVPAVQISFEGTGNTNQSVGMNGPSGGGQATLPMVWVDGVAPSFGDSNIGITQPWSLNGPSIPALASMTGATPTVVTAQGTVGVFWTGNSGTTSVTNITGGLAPGQLLIIFGADGGKTTLVNGHSGAGSIKLVDGNNVTLANGQSVMLVLQSSGNWYQPNGAYLTAGGDLTGSYPNPQVQSITGVGNVCGVSCTLEPTDDSWDCGIPGERWHAIYCTEGVFGGTSTTGAGRNMTVQAEAALASSDDNGGDLILAGGAKDGSGTNGYINLNTAVASSATAGGNGAVPSQVAGYVVVKIAGTVYKIPYFAV